MKVLIVEDSERMARSLQKGLVEETYAVDVAADGIRGLQMARGGDYDLVLLDVNLPGMDGSRSSASCARPGPTCRWSC